MRAALGVLADVLCVLAFVMIGRASHQAGESLAGVTSTAWPFLAGLAACLWASSGLLLGQGLRLLDPIATNMIRFPVAAIVFTAYVAAVRPSEVLTRRLAALSGCKSITSGFLRLPVKWADGVECGHQRGR